AGWSSAREAADRRRATAAANKGAPGAISAPYLLATLSGALAQDDIVVNEAIRNAPLVQEQIRRTRPHSYVGLAGGGLGFSGGMAIVRTRGRRARLQRRHGAGPEAGAAGAAHRADHRRRRLSLFLAGFSIRRRPAISNSDSDCCRRQWRLAGGQVVGAAGLSEGHRCRDQFLSIATALRTEGKAAKLLRYRPRIRLACRIRRRAG